MKTAYPQKYDSSVELPIIKNLTQITPEILNSYRSAIIQLEKAIGLMPQGSVSGGLSERIAVTLDSAGHIKKDALDSAGVIYGPIENKHISSYASISEAKLKLDYPTKLLNSSISLLKSEFSEFSTKLDDVTLKLSSHLSELAINRHSASQITIDNGYSRLSNVAAAPTDESLNVQELTESFYKKHLGYTGDSISSNNNSHFAAQIYFDPTDVSENLTSSDVQSVLEDLVTLAIGQQDNHQNLFHSSGVLKKSNISSANGQEYLAEELSVTFYANSIGDSYNKISISLADETQIFGLSCGDIVDIVDSSQTYSYIISDVILGSVGVTDIICFGKITFDSTSGTIINIRKAKKITTPEWALKTVALEAADKTSANRIQVANPAAAAVYSKGFIHNSITLTKNEITIIYNEVEYLINCYNSSYSVQTIDAVISAINESAAETAAPFCAFKFKSSDTNNYEIAIVASSTGQNDEMTIARAGDAIDLLGFSWAEDIIFNGNNGVNYYILGKKLNGLKTILSETGLQFETGAKLSGVDFSTTLAQIGDNIIIKNSTGNNGCYEIIDIDADFIYVNSAQLLGGEWANLGANSAEFFIQNNIVNLENYNFIKTLGSYGCLLGHVVVLSDGYVNTITIAEYQTDFRSGKNLYSIKETNYTKSTDIQLNCNFELINNDLYIYLDSLNKYKVTDYKNNEIVINSMEYNCSLTIYIYDAQDIIDYLIANSITEKSFAVFVFGSKLSENMLILSTYTYTASNGRVEGGPSRAPGIINNDIFGVVDKYIISESFVKDIVNDIYKMTRVNGTSYGMELLSAEIVDETYNIVVSSGVGYIKDKKLTIPYIEYNTGISDSYDKILIAINYEGHLVAEVATTDCTFYLNPLEYIIIGIVENNSVGLNIIDMRYLISQMENRVSSYITVGNSENFGHFSSVNSALKYAKRYSQIYSGMGIPEIKLLSGTHYIEVTIPANKADVTIEDLIKYTDEAGILIDFPVIISGCGASTKLDIIYKYLDYADDDRVTECNNKGMIVVLSSPAMTAPYSSTNFSDSIFKISNLSILKSKIVFIDPIVSRAFSGSSAIYINKTIIDAVVFDFSGMEFDAGLVTLEDTYYFSSASCIELLKVEAASEDYLGSITIQNCIFNTCFIDLNIETRLSNLTISNNTFFATSQQELSTNLAFLIKIPNSYFYPGINTSYYLISNNYAGVVSNSYLYVSEDASYKKEYYEVLSDYGFLQVANGFAADYDIFLQNGISSPGIISNATDTQVVSETLTINSTTTTITNSTIIENLTVSDELTVDGATEFTSTVLMNAFTVSGFALFNLALTVFNGSVNMTGDLDVTGAFTAGSKSFKIKHPEPSKKDYYLVHSTVETNTAGDNIYRWSQELTFGENEIILESYHKFLNANNMVWISPVEHFGAAWGKVDDVSEKLKVMTSAAGKYNILLISTRIDEVAKNNWAGAEVKAKEVK